MPQARLATNKQNSSATSSFDRKTSATSDILDEKHCKQREGNQSFRISTEISVQKMKRVEKRKVVRSNEMEKGLNLLYGQHRPP